MVDLSSLVSGAALFLVVAAMATLMAGLRRIPWRFGAVIGLGTGTVLTAVFAATTSLADPPILVLIGAIGGAVTQQAFDRGEQERRRISEAITAVPSRPAV